MNPRPWFALPVVAAIVTGGCGGRGGAVPDGGGGSDGGGPDIATTVTWGGDVTLHLGAQAPTSVGLTLRVMDRATPPTLDVTREFPPTTSHPTNGAFLGTLSGCGVPGLPGIHEVTIRSCAGVADDLYSAEPGCLAIKFDKSGFVAGHYLHPDGVACDLDRAEATVTLPVPIYGTGPDGGPPPFDVAAGSVLAHCSGAGGLDLDFEASFAIPVVPYFLLCQGM